jgi:hypothetical protein
MRQRVGRDGSGIQYIAFPGAHVFRVPCLSLPRLFGRLVCLLHESFCKFNQE